MFGYGAAALFATRRAHHRECASHALSTTCTFSSHTQRKYVAREQRCTSYAVAQRGSSTTIGISRSVRRWYSS
jgi:hypothetical protein